VEWVGIGVAVLSLLVTIVLGCCCCSRAGACNISLGGGNIDANKIMALGDVSSHHVSVEDTRRSTAGQPEIELQN